jgi:cobalt/nickel transport protein
MTTKEFLLAGFVVTLLLAGGVSLIASSSPDGLEYVAGRTGFADTAADSAAAGGPLADYRTTGIEDERISRGVAGLVGTLSVAVIAGGLFWALRRRAKVDDRMRSG